MRRIRFISTQPHEVLGAVRQQGDVLEVDDEIAADLLRRPELFEDAETSVSSEEAPIVTTAPPGHSPHRHPGRPADAPW